MSLPTRGSASVEVDAPVEVVYDLVTDVTRMGEWSPECRRCEWLDEPARAGSRFKGHNQSGLARWTTTAEVVAADRPRTFEFTTLWRGHAATRWTYELEDLGGRTRLTESFSSESTPWLIGVVERLFVRDRQEQLEAGIAGTLAALKSVAEGGTTPAP